MGTISEKLTYLNTTKGKIKDAINLTGANILSEDTFRSYAEKLKQGLVDAINDGGSTIYSNFPKTTGTGTEIALNDTYEAPMEIGLNGNTHQDSYTGKNLWNNSQITDTTIIKNQNNGFRMTRTSSGNSSPVYNIDLKANTTYTISCSNKTGTTTDQIVYCRWTKSDGTYLWTPNISSTSQTITVGSLNITNVMFYIQSAQQEGTYVEISDLMISTSGGDYEPFVGGSPSPSPDFPQQIEVVTGDNTINIHGKNLLNYLDIPNAPSWSLWPEGKYLEFTLTPNMQYTLSSNVPQGSSTLLYLNGDSTASNGVWVNNSKTATSDSNGKIFVAIFPNRQYYSDIIDGTYYIQLEQGSTASDYEEYQGKDYEISLGDIELCKIGDYQDYIYKENNKWYKHSEIGKVVLDGSENWNYFGNMFYVDNLINDYLKENIITSICNQYKGSTNSATTQASYNNGNNTISFRTGDALNRVLIRDDRYNSVVNLKPWLSSNNSIVYYILATPTNTEITDTDLIEQLEELEKAKSVDDKTFISQINEQLPFILDVSALSKN